MVAGPVVETLAREDDVWCLARFTDEAARARLEAQGIRTFRWELGAGGLAELPDDSSHVLHAAAYPGLDGGTWERVISVNCVGAGELMTHCQRAEAFLFVSMTAVYSQQPPGHLYTTLRRPSRNGFSAASRLSSRDDVDGDPGQPGHRRDRLVVAIAAGERAGAPRTTRPQATPPGSPSAGRGANSKLHNYLWVLELGSRCRWRPRPSRSRTS